ncbi:aspartate aminotransferase family protein [Candidatus Methanodesulfokora washburnensis]|jgi:4-aminobutyrate aminotransferase|uniref:Aspartate aminotransferase family protein n=1 Tax=Candidatus Methanodesulfokora washburnensis TaxID=2478471 RepID=A0A3R9R800_9CREN|nr:aspartate aminotransferase family protein [Candidatus Methanodesulfokores washburnensis]RSN76892.1 aspartate aminotransferase family protein [Candidatus Methanodesulfokores washburnensis]
MSEDLTGLRKLTNKKIDKSLEIVAKDKKYLARAIGLKYFPLVVARADGSKVWDMDGNEYIDFLTSAAVYNVGHRNPRVVKAIKEQVDKFLNYTVVYLYAEPCVKLAEKLISITPGNFDKKVTYGFSGSDGVDSAVKVARAYTRRRFILSFYGSYHGMTYGALSTTGIVSENLKASVFPLAGIEYAHFPDPYRNKWGIDGYEHPDELTSRALKEIEDKIKEHASDVAGLLVEPIQGDAGVVVPPAEFIKGIRELADTYGFSLIDEEVQTGIGRTGKFWAIEHFNVVPDILVSAKALGGGMPISAVIGRSDMMDSVPSPLLVFTHAGHAVSASAALATIEAVEDEKLVDRASETGEYIIRRLREMQDKFDIIGDVRGKGLLIGVEIVRKGKEPDRQGALKICWRAWEKGLILISFGRNGNVLRIAPPLNISKEDVDRALDIIESSIREFLEGKIPDGVLDYLKGW